MRTARAREAARREEKGVNVAHATLLESQGEWVEREVENSRSTGLLLGKGNVHTPRTPGGPSLRLRLHLSNAPLASARCW